MAFLATLISTFFYTGLAPKAPGTVGTFATSLLIVISYMVGLPIQAFVSTYAILFLAALYLVGWWVTAVYMKHTGKHDPKEVVIDETLGMYMTYMIFFAIFPSSYTVVTEFMVMSCVMFLAFRFFDILKPFPVSFFDKKMDNAHGVMLDDAMAGVYAGLVSSAIFFCYLQFSF